ncbi:unnamed protein product [Boreogadus saida]
MLSFHFPAHSAVPLPFRVPDGENGRKRAVPAVCYSDGAPFNTTEYSLARWKSKLSAQMRLSGLFDSGV